MHGKIEIQHCQWNLVSFFICFSSLMKIQRTNSSPSSTFFCQKCSTFHHMVSFYFLISSFASFCLFFQHIRLLHLLPYFLHFVLLLIKGFPYATIIFFSSVFVVFFKFFAPVIWFFTHHLDDQCVKTTVCEIILQTIQDYFVFFGQIIKNVDHKIFITNVTF